MKLKRFFYKMLKRGLDDTFEIELEQAEELVRMQNAVFLDVRSPQEYAEGHIDNAILIPDYEINKKAKEILWDKEQIIIVYCSTGIRSKKVAKILKRMRYKKVYILLQ